MDNQFCVMNDRCRSHVTPEFIESRRLAAEDIAQTLPKRMTIGQGYDYACWIETTFPQLRSLAQMMQRSFQNLKDMTDPPWRPENVQPIAGTLVIKSVDVIDNGAVIHMEAEFEIDEEV